MPYAYKKDRVQLDPLVRNLELAIRAAAKGTKGNMALWQYLRYSALRVVRTTAMDSTKRHLGRDVLRYWIVAIGDGIFMNIGRELTRRLALPDPDAERATAYAAFERSLQRSKPENRRELDEAIDALAREITKIANVYNYDGAFAGLCNYCLSSVGPLIAGTHGFSEANMQKLVYFWCGTANEFYRVIGIPYEDEQIAKPEIGDCAIFISLLKKLSAKGRSASGGKKAKPRRGVPSRAHKREGKAKSRAYKREGKRRSSS